MRSLGQRLGVNKLKGEPSGGARGNCQERGEGIVVKGRSTP